MYQHHVDSINNLVSLFKQKDEVIAIILGGSIAKGQEKETSDIDAMVILTDHALKEYLEKNKRSEGITGHCTYEGGYFDIKYFNKNFLVRAAKEGSEPTRNSFIGARCIYTKDDSIDDLIRKIPVYPVHQKQEKIISFLSALILNAFFFFDESIKRNDAYLRARTSTEIVLYGLRMLLAHNEHLFPCQKWLISAVEKLPNKPEGIVQLAYSFLENPTEENKTTFVMSILSFTNWGVDIQAEFTMLVSKFIQDQEIWWYESRPNIAEW